VAPLALQNKRGVYNVRFRARPATLLEIARDPKRLGADMGFFGVLHTWNKKLEHFDQVHAAGSLPLLP
jgi:hypothetical protein